jgi:alkylhydroperoxidase family enzyme
MAHIQDSVVAGTPYEKVMGHAPHILEPWNHREGAFFRQSVLPAPLLEQVRKALAQEHGCAYCQSKSGPPSDPGDALRTSMAVGLAQLYSSGHKHVEPAHLKALRAHFSEAELVELVAFICFMWAGGAFGHIFGVQPLPDGART